MRMQFPSISVFARIWQMLTWQGRCMRQCTTQAQLRLAYYAMIGHAPLGCTRHAGFWSPFVSKILWPQHVFASAVLAR